jgi:hypothetical protein
VRPHLPNPTRRTQWNLRTKKGEGAQNDGMGRGRGRERMPERPWDSRKDHTSIPVNQSAASKLFQVSPRVGSSIIGELDAVSKSVPSRVGMQSSKLLN